jgi:predicted helicase
MMAPYAIAHMKIGLKLYETGYRFASAQRANIYLTNALEEPSQDGNKQLIFSDWFPALAHEAQAVNEVKQNTQFTVVIGNPPYSGHSWNLQPELRRMVDAYKIINGERIKEKGALQLEKSVQEDYIKFIRFAEIQISKSNVGIVGMVTSHGFLDNPSLRGMRNSIEKTFNQILVIDLHGNSLRHEKSPDGSVDKNVFDIKKTGVAISLFSKFANHEGYEIKHSELWGDRELVKYPRLQHTTIASTPFTTIESNAPFFLLIPELGTNIDEYQDYFSIAEIMQTYSKGVVTGRDAFLIDLDEENLLSRMRSFSDKSKSDEWLIKEFDLNPTAWWSVSKARHDMPPETQYQQYIRPLLYRPFDIRPCFYHPAVFMSPRRPVMKHMEPKFNNILLLTSRMTKGENFGHVTLSKGLAEAILLSSKTSNNAMIFPLYLYPDEEIEGNRLNLGLKREPNLSKPFLAAITERLDMPVVDGSGDFKSGIGVDDILHYFVAILHSNEYRSRYSVQLTRDFPRIPITSNIELFRQLCGLGKELVGLHLLEDKRLENRGLEISKVKFVAGGKSLTTGHSSLMTVSKGYPKYEDGKVYINAEAHFAGVPAEVWEFHIGGYQVCAKWLKDRRERELSAEELVHYGKVVSALGETIRLMREVDAVIESAGGWPVK